MLHKYGNCTRQLKKKRVEFFFAGETMIEGKTRFVPELSKEEELQLIENATPGSTKKATKYGIKIFREPLLEEKSTLS